MGLILLILFVAVPLIEIMIFIEVGDAIGAWQTVALVVLTAVIGSWMIRQQGLITLRRVQEELNAGRVATHELFNGFCLLVAGVLMLTPGFMTDGIGFLLLFPVVRDWLWSRAGGHYMKKYSKKYQAKSRESFHFQSNFKTPSEDNPWQRPRHEEYGSEDKGVIDGNFVDVTPSKDDPPKKE